MVEVTTEPVSVPMETPLQEAVRLAGGQAALAREATKFASNGKKLTQAMIWKWMNRARGPVPADIWVIPIEKAVRGRVSRRRLRPDLYPEEQLLLA